VLFGDGAGDFGLAFKGADGAGGEGIEDVEVIFEGVDLAEGEEGEVADDGGEFVLVEDVGEVGELVGDVEFKADVDLAFEAHGVGQGRA
jgi:hypothetical protein